MWREYHALVFMELVGDEWSRTYFDVKGEEGSGVMDGDRALSSNQVNSCLTSP
jgi:hypothetical protein